MNHINIDKEKLLDSIKMACNWLANTAQIKTDDLLCEKNSRHLQHSKWKGAIRGEYSAAKAEWDFFCPVWHTGQAVKSLILSHRLLGDNQLLEAAKLGADFIGSERNSDKEDKNYGLIYAFEGAGDRINTSAILECLDGLIFLGEETGDKKYWDWTEKAVSWIVEKAFIKGEGLFRDNFSITSLKFEKPSWYNHPDFAGIKGNMPGRPLLDDGIFLKVFRKTGNMKYKKIFYETADRLMKEEQPPGNWVNIVPAAGGNGPIHPRHAYWWGLPMIMAYKDSKDKKYLECACRSGEWYIKAQRSDGGLIRNTYTDFNTDSFGHATSGIACAALLWQELLETTGDNKWIQPIEKAIHYCMNLQFTNPKDLNLKGSILEKVLPPDGTDKSPYHLRDLGTIFFIQAASVVLAF